MAIQIRCGCRQTGALRPVVRQWRLEPALWLLATMTTACTLRANLDQVFFCRSDSDCLSGFRCRQNTCRPLDWQPDMADLRRPDDSRSPDKTPFSDTLDTDGPPVRPDTDTLRDGREPDEDEDAPADIPPNVDVELAPDNQPAHDLPDHGPFDLADASLEISDLPLSADELPADNRPDPDPDAHDSDSRDGRFDSRDSEFDNLGTDLADSDNRDARHDIEGPNPDELSDADSLDQNGNDQDSHNGDGNEQAAPDTFDLSPLDDSPCPLRTAPSGQSFCLPTGAACVADDGSGMQDSETRCAENRLYTCTASADFSVSFCPAAPDCEIGGCDPQGIGCQLSVAPDTTLCAAGAGVCQAGLCLPLRYPLPTDLPWTPVASTPQAAVPENCGPAELPCNPAGFTFIWPADTSQTQCSDSFGVLSDPCPATAGSAECAMVDSCGQDAQYGWDLTAPGWDSDRFAAGGTEPQPTVRDTWTGLVWQPSFAPDKSWSDALAYCRDLAVTGWAGYTDWRLPDRFELLSLVDFGNPEIASAFPEMPATAFWSATTLPVRPPWEQSAWQVQFATGFVQDALKTGAYAARCVRREPTAASLIRFWRSAVDVAQPVIFDTLTGLLWQGSQVSDLNWPQALAACEALVYAGRDDWRLPNIFEWAALADPTQTNRATDPALFTDCADGFFWSATSAAGNRTRAWHFNGTNGALLTSAKDRTAGFVVRCVALGP